MDRQGAVGVVLRQLRAVRRRANLQVVYHAIAVWIAVAAGALALVVLAVVRGGPVVFALVALASLGAVIVTTAMLARLTARRWLRAAAAAARIDAARGLRSRLPSVLELGDRAQDSFVALLVRQNREALPRWRPEDVVPEVIPARPLLAAVASLVALVLAVVFAPALRAPAPRVEIGDRRMDFVRSGQDDEDEDADRILVAPGTEHPASERGEEADAAPTDAATDAGTLAELSGSLQDWLQDALGAQEHWETGEQMPASGAGDMQDPPRGRPRDRGGPARAGADADTAGGTGPESDAEGPASRRATADRGEPGAGAGDGAGTDTDAALYGAPHDDVTSGSDRFELAIAARVRTRRGARMAPWTTAPGAEGGRHTALAPQQRADQPGHRMAVPAALEPLVRRLYTHAPPGGTP